MSATAFAVPPPGLEPAPRGWVWAQGSVGAGGGATWKLVESGGAEDALAAAQHRIAFRQHEAREARERELESTISTGADAALRAVPSDEELGVDCEDLSVARAALVRGEAWLTLARRRLADAQERASKHLALVAKRDSAATELEALETSVREQFEAFNAYGSQCPEPDSRDVDRARLQALLASAEWECGLSAASGDGLVVGVAERVVSTLESRLPDLRSRVLLEVAQPTINAVRELVDKLRQPLSVLCSLAPVDTLNVVREQIDVMVDMPVGDGVGISVDSDEAITAQWRGMMDALIDDPHAVLSLTTTKEPVKRSGIFKRR